MRPILPVVVSMRNEAYIRLVDERGRLKHMPGPFSSEMRSGEDTQLRVDEFQKATNRVRCAGIHLAQKNRNVARDPRGHRCTASRRVSESAAASPRQTHAVARVT